MTISNLDKIVNPTIQLLMNSKYMFYLTGSRVFGNAKLFSDYDFFTQDNDGVRDFLEACMFSCYSDRATEYPDDPNIAKVYSYGNVQVQLVKDVVLKVKAQEILLGLPTIPWDRGDTFDKKIVARKWWIWAFNKAHVIYERDDDDSRSVLG